MDVLGFFFNFAFHKNLQNRCPFWKGLPKCIDILDSMSPDILVSFCLVNCSKKNFRLICIHMIENLNERKCFHRYSYSNAFFFNLILDNSKEFNRMDFILNLIKLISKQFLFKKWIKQRPIKTEAKLFFSIKCCLFTLNKKYGSTGTVL